MQNMAEHFGAAIEDHREEIEKALKAHMEEISEAQRKLELEEYENSVKTLLASKEVQNKKNGRKRH